MKLKNTPNLLVVTILLIISNATANDHNILAHFDMINQDYINLPVTIADKEYIFILDTGCTMNAFDISLSHCLGEEKGVMPVATGDNIMQIKIYDAPEAFVGSIKLGCKEVACLDLTIMSMIEGRKISGVIGMDFLRQYIVQLDFDTGKILFFKSNSNKNPDWGDKFNLRYYNNISHLDKQYYIIGQPYIDMTICDNIKVAFLIDTGSDGSIDLNSNIYNKIVDKEKLKTTKTIVATISGEHETECVRYKNFSIKPFGVHEVIIGSNPMHNLIGTEYLSRYLVTFDFPNSKVYFKKNKNFSKVKEVDMSGLSLRLISNSVVVHSVDAGSPSEKSGIQAKDIILKMNHKDANKYEIWELRELLKSGDMNRITMTIKRNDEIREISFLLNKEI